MNYTHLFSITWDDSYNEPDYSIPGTFNVWIAQHEQERKRLAKLLRWLASQLRQGTTPFVSKPEWEQMRKEKE